MKLEFFFRICLFFCFEAKAFSSNSIEQNNYTVKEFHQSSSIRHSRKNKNKPFPSLSNRVKIQATPLIEKKRKITNLIIKGAKLNRKGNIKHSYSKKIIKFSSL